MKLISIGFGNFVAPERIIAAVDPESNPIKRVVAQAREGGRLIDATFGRKTKTVLVMDSDHVILCPVEPEELSRRAAGGTGGDTNEAQ
ncbi:MAG: DUF370 domain-containing protein [Oscillospiraceae bacterium]|nr:DUF370 domain-containing protein [Oscillospiraceae bacterium]